MKNIIVIKDNEIKNIKVINEKSKNNLNNKIK